MFDIVGHFVLFSYLEAIYLLPFVRATNQGKRKYQIKVGDTKSTKSVWIVNGREEYKPSFLSHSMVLRKIYVVFVSFFNISFLEKEKWKNRIQRTNQKTLFMFTPLVLLGKLFLKIMLFNHAIRSTLQPRGSIYSTSFSQEPYKFLIHILIRHSVNGGLSHL